MWQEALSMPGTAGRRRSMWQEALSMWQEALSMWQDAPGTAGRRR